MHCYKLDVSLVLLLFILALFRSVEPLPTSSMNNFAVLTDEQLINIFIDGVIRGERPLQANKNLRIEPLFDSLQLLSNREGILARVNLKKIPNRIEVRQNTSFYSLIHKILFNQKYLPFKKMEGGSTYQYRYCNLPEGYTLFCTTVKELWLASWGRGFSLRSGIPLDLIIWQTAEGYRQSPWQSLIGMSCDRGQLVVKMLGNFSVFEGTDLIVWAKADKVTPRTRAKAYRERLKNRY
jgi:hypothetical protein